jgi:hypothetical protein
MACGLLSGVMGYTQLIKLINISFIMDIYTLLSSGYGKLVVRQNRRIFLAITEKYTEYKGHDEAKEYGSRFLFL